MQSFGLCGVRVHKKKDHAIIFDQTSHVPLLGSTVDICVESNAVESDTDWTAACGSVERDAIEDVTTNAQIDQRDKQTYVQCQN